MTSARPYVTTQQPASVYYSESVDVQPPYNPAVTGQPYNPTMAGQPYNPAVAGQPYNPALAGQPYNPALAGQPYNPAVAGQPYKPQVTVVTQPRQPTPNSCIAYSIFTCICCCWPLGILAIVFSCKSSDASNHGDMDKARSYGKKACIVSSVALLCGIAIIVAVVVTQVVAASSTSSTYYYYSNRY